MMHKFCLWEGRTHRNMGAGTTTADWPRCYDDPNAGLDACVSRDLGVHLRSRSMSVGKLTNVRVSCLLAALALAGWTDRTTGGDENSRFVPVDTSRLMGTPDPMPLETEIAFPRLQFERSEIYARMSRRGSRQMPPLATNVTDDEALAVLRRWIAGL
jgi:hypothetical protein